MVTFIKQDGVFQSDKLSCEIQVRAQSFEY